MSLTAVGNNPTFAQELTYNPGAIPANTVSDQTFTCKGLRSDGIVVVNAPSLEVGLILVNASCRANDVLDLKLWNNTGSLITPAAQTMVVYQP